MSLSKIVNIGKTLEKELNDVGIESIEELRQVGACEALLRIGVSGSACYNKLYALEGALRGIRWHDIPKEEKASLKEAYDLRKNV